MKIYGCPEACPAPEPDYASFDFDAILKLEEKHCEDLKAWLLKAGYTGKYTGEIIRFSVADGQASYMVADGKKSFLIHLPYGDAYQYEGAQWMPKRAVIERIEKQKRLAAIFSKNSGK